MRKRNLRQGSWKNTAGFRRAEIQFPAMRLALKQNCARQSRAQRRMDVRLWWNWNPTRL